MTDSTTKSRRDFLKQASLFGASLAVGTAHAESNKNPTTTQATCEPQKSTVPFYGKHQAGIITPAQKHIYFIVLDLHTQDIEAVKEMFQTWTQYSANLAQGKFVKESSSNRFVPPVDTGEAASLSTYNLTLTFGVSPSFFDKLGISRLKPEGFAELPHFPRDQLRPEYTGGDICIQACADDSQVAFHAAHNLVRVARGNVTMKWSQDGFNSFEKKETPRNLLGFRDGTGNPQTDKDMADVVWYKGDNWLNGGSYLVARRIQMFLETWDRTSLSEQENTFGRHRESGAPFGAKHEFDPVDLEKKDEKGRPLIPIDSHVHLAHKTGLMINRRSFSYASGIDPKTGQFDAGLMFVAFQNDLNKFITIQNSLGNVDKLNEYITHIGSGTFACFAGVKDENDYIGKALFDAI